MNANEFRIGNLVYKSLKSGNGRIIIDKIGAQDIARIYENAGSFNYEVIPLTTEWLITFGFISKYKSIHTHWSYGSFGIEQVPDEDDDGNSIDEKQEFTYGFTHLPKIKYVHQLQNLYFALTGEELKSPKP